MQQRFRRNPSIETAPLDQESILFDPAANRFVVLNSTSVFLWNLLEQDRSMEQLVQAICDEFDGVTMPEALRDVEAALDEMASKKLIIGKDIDGTGLNGNKENTHEHSADPK